MSNPTSEDTIPAYGEDINRKRSYSSEESEDENEVIVKRKKKDSNDEIISKLGRVVAKLIKEMKHVHRTFTKLDEDMDKVEDQVDENKRNISRERMFKQMDGSEIHMEMKRFYQKS